jgi:cation diffusion facilitator CzcD-associated flavoprotein CzcO
MSNLTQPRIVVIGSGVSGILMGIQLRERGLLNFTILEKATTLGGTWRDNRYPGVACDVPAHLYSFSFEPNPNWTHRFATGAQLWDYFNGVAEKYGVAAHIRYGKEVTDARLRGREWILTTADGETLAADIVVSAVGRLHHPSLPDIAGLEDFAGTLVHSAQWDPSIDLEGKRLGVIGTGSSATQITTATVDTVDRLTLFQRTAQWVWPVPNEKVPWWRRLRLKLSRSYGLRYYRELEEFINEIGRAAKGDAAAVEARNTAVREALAAVRDPELRAKLTPDYEIGCKRLVISGRFYDAVQRPNVDVVTDPILQVEPAGLRTADGVLHPLDVLVLATGFHADSYLRPMTVTGQDGVDLDKLWAEVPMNYKSVALPHMPNFFMINGPFSPGGSASVLSIIETHVGYVMQLIDRVVENGVTLAPDPFRSAELLNEIRERASKTVWGTGGCTSWYLDKNGVPLVNPLLLEELAEDMRVPVFDDYVVERSA